MLINTNLVDRYILISLLNVSIKIVEPRQHNQTEENLLDLRIKTVQCISVNTSDDYLINANRASAALFIFK